MSSQFIQLKKYPCPFSYVYSMHAETKVNLTPPMCFMSHRSVFIHVCSQIFQVLSQMTDACGLCLHCLPCVPGSMARTRYWVISVMMVLQIVIQEFTTNKHEFSMEQQKKISFLCIFEWHGAVCILFLVTHNVMHSVECVFDFRHP